jgi:hypothetical protein
LLVLGEFLAEPGHGPVEVVQLKGITPLDLVVNPPLVGGPVAAGVEQAVQDRQEDGPLDIELKVTSVQESLDDPVTTGLLPEPLEDQGGSDASGGDGGELSFGVGREQEDGLSQASPRGQQGIELASLLPLVEPSQGGDDPLSGSPALPAVLDDLEVGTWAGGLGPEEHGALVFGSP